MAEHVGRSPKILPDPVIEVYKKDIDRTLLRENLKRTPEERLLNLQAFANAILKLREAVRRRA